MAPPVFALARSTVLATSTGAALLALAASGTARLVSLGGAEDPAAAAAGTLPRGRGGACPPPPPSVRAFAALAAAAGTLLIGAAAASLVLRPDDPARFARLDTLGCVGALLGVLVCDGRLEWVELAVGRGLLPVGLLMGLLSFLGVFT